jgi:two-component system aerobic respiration control sensor histidine kinase ArcB
MMQSMELFESSKDICFESLFNLFKVNFLWVDAKGYVLGCNKEILDFYNMTDVNDIIGKHHLEFSSQSLWETTQEVIKTGNSITAEEILTKENGEPVYFLSMKSPIKAKDGKIIGAVVLAVDITDRKLLEFELEKALEASQLSDRTKTQFLRNMRHDLRTPLSGILTISEYLENSELDPEKKQYLGDIHKSSHSLLNHLNEILDYVKIESGELPIIDKKFDIYKLLDDTYRMMRTIAVSKKLDFTVSVDISTPKNLIGDCVRTERILINLISNAIKFTEKGHVHISINWIPKTETKGVVQFTIEDTGIGIPEDKQNMVFERFNKLNASYSGVYTGAGLGLKLVKQFLEEIGGQHELESEPGKGTIFKVFIPYTIPLV